MFPLQNTLIAHDILRKLQLNAIKTRRSTWQIPFGVTIMLSKQISEIITEVNNFLVQITTWKRIVLRLKIIWLLKASYVWQDFLFLSDNYVVSYVWQDFLFLSDNYVLQTNKRKIKQNTYSDISRKKFVFSFISFERSIFHYEKSCLTQRSRPKCLS